MLTVLIGLVTVSQAITGGKVEQLLSCGMTCVSSNKEKRQQCGSCLLDVVHRLRISEVPLKYATDMLAFRATSQDYVSGFCQQRGDLGVDLSEYPTGWKPVVQNGTVTGYTGCEKTINFPGVDVETTSAHAEVTALLKEVPRRQNAGEIWRGNELGLLVLNDLFYEGVNPKAIGLGSSVKQHIVVRPYLDRQFGSCDQACKQKLFSTAKAMIDSKNNLTSTDVSMWVYENLFDAVFPGAQSPFTPAQFVEMQGGLIGLQVITQILPGFVSRPMSADVREAKENYVSGLKDLVRQYYPEVESMDCSPTPNCVDQLANGFADAFVAAGGLSIPSGVTTGLWVLYGNTARYGDMFPQGVKLNEVGSLPFFYESLRFFAPVVGFPWWSPQPTNPAEDQFRGGYRYIMNLALAQRDPNAWGADADKFRVREMSEYHQKFVGFAEGAEDATVADGAMNRVCPAKYLALQMGKAFFDALNQEEWEFDGEDENEFKLVTPFVENVVLRRKSTQ